MRRGHASRLSPSGGKYRTTGASGAQRIEFYRRIGIDGAFRRHANHRQSIIMARCRRLALPCSRRRHHLRVADSAQRRLCGGICAGDGGDGASLLRGRGILKRLASSCRAGASNAGAARVSAPINHVEDADGEPLQATSK